MNISHEDTSIKVYSKYGPEYVPVSAEEESIGYDIICPEDIELNMHEPYYFLDLGIVISGPKEFNPVLESLGLKWGYFIIPRSSSSKLLLKFVNTIGVVDPSYRGQNDTIKVALEFSPPSEKIAIEKMTGICVPNEKQGVIGKDIIMRDWEFEDTTFDRLFIKINKGERIGQIVFLPILKPVLEYAGTLEENKGQDRGGFGSTGK